jgi:lysophospholipase L1-like esterase
VIRRWLAAAGAVLLLPLAACARAESESRPRFTQSDVQADPIRPLRIMPLGDSITDGMGVAGGYRTDLWQYFRADGQTVQFVGSEYGGPPALGDRDHEGHPGWETAQLDRHVTSWLRTYEPDIVLLHIGTNDVLHGKAPTAPARLRTLLGHIVSAAPQAKVYVASIIPLRLLGLDARVRRYNRAVSRIVAEEAAGGAHVRMVDMHSAVEPSDLLDDGIHPDGGGFSKMAARWYGALRSAPMTRTEAENPASATVNDGERLEISSASGGGKVGYLDNPDSFVQFEVTEPAAGRYRLYVRAANGAATACSQQITVDGRPDGVVSYPPYGQDQWAISGADVSLKAGPNTLRLSHGSCGAEVDAIELAPRPPDADW